MTIYYRIFILLGLILGVFAQGNSLLQSGPMLGAIEMREAKIWLQTKVPANVEIKYWQADNPRNKLVTEEYVSENPANTYLIRLPYLEPGTTYRYEVYINHKKVNFDYPLKFKTPPLWQWRTDPPEFRVALGSCFFVNEQKYDRPGKPYGKHSREIIEQLTRENADIMLWLGDNVYYREADWFSLSGMIYRYTHVRSQPYLQKFLASAIHLAIWDDHDFGPNDSDGSFRDKENALNVFKWFWANPTYGTKEVPGIFTYYEYGDVAFFLTDNRYHRSANGRVSGKKQLLGDEQIDWLINALKSSRAKFKIIAFGNQVLNPAAKYENYNASFEEERSKLLDLIVQENIPGVFFLSGDRHHTELTKYKPRRDFYPLYDLTVSPLSSSAHDSSNEGNYLRVPGTMVATQNYAILTFSGPRKDRQMKITVKDYQGNIQWEKVIKASQLK